MWLKNEKKQINPIGDNIVLPFSSENRNYTDDVWDEINKYI